MKKNMIALSLLLAFSAHAKYAIIVDKNNNSYKIEAGYTKVVEESPWVDSGSPVCINDINEDDLYYGNIDLQTTSCDQLQERTVIVKKVFSDGSEEIISSKKETQTINTETTQNIVGTHLENSCNNALSFDSNLQTGNYHISINGTQLEVICDMDTDGGGWTKVANVPNMVKVMESSSWISASTLSNGSASMGVKFFNEINPSAIMLENKSSSSAYGSGDLIVITRTGATWNWTPGAHNNDTNQSGRFFDNSANTWSNLGAVVYASHRDEPWQSSPFSFSINGIQNGYSGNYESRLSLGGTFLTNSGPESSHRWYSFYGNQHSVDPVGHGDWWGNGQGAGAIWMK